MKHFFSKSIILALIGFNSVVVCAQQTVSIDVKASVKPISPLIYGANNATTNATAIRWGGNRTSAYNWENNFSNAGADYNHISDRFFTIGATNSTTPALPILNMVNTANARKQYTLVTLQAAGYVSRDANGEVFSAEKAPSNRWDSVMFRKNAEFTLSPDLTDGYVYIDEMINYLNNKLGVVGNGGIDAFAIDNEPALWGTTHPRIRPAAISHAEVFYKTTELGKVIKEISPKAEVYGPMFYGWWDAKNFAGLGYPLNKGYAWYVDFYLDSLQKIETSLNMRILDVLAVHWYPEAIGNVTLKRIVDLGQNNAPTAEELVAPDMVQARLQAPRSLWDESYKELGNINLSESLRLIKRLQSSINTFYSGTKLAFTEFKYDAEFHFSGGLALADVLGVFGKEGVYMASKWDPINDDFGGSAYKLYLNYNNQGGAFGNVSVDAQTNDNAVLSTFASIDENNNLHIIVINKSDAQKTTDFSIANGYYSHGEVYGFDQTDKTLRQFTAIPSIINNSFTYSLPAYSASHMVLYAKPQVTIISAKVSPSNASEIVFECSGEIFILDNTNVLTECAIVDENLNEFAIQTIELEGNNSIKITLTNPISATDSLLFISYTGVSIVDNTNLPIADAVLQITNELASAPLFVISAEVTETGKQIELFFSKQLHTQVEQQSGLTVFVNGVSVSLDSSKLFHNGYGLLMYTSDRIIKDNSVTIENTGTVLQAVDSKLASYFNIVAQNNGPNYSAIVDSAIIDNNFRIRIYIDKLLEPVDLSSAGFELFENGNPMDFTISYSNKVITLLTVNPMFNEYAYTLKYTDNGILTTLFGGYMDSFDGYGLTNILNPTPDYVAIPSKIEAEYYAYHNSSSVLENCTDVGGGKQIAFIATGNVFGYHISAAQADSYTLTLRHASSSQKGAVSVWVDGQKIAYLFLPVTGSWTKWVNSSVVIPLEQGNHTIEIKVISAGFNLNYIQFEEGEHPSPGILQSAQVQSDGTKLMLVYDRQFSVLPELNEIDIRVDTKDVDITNITFVGTDSTRLFLIIDTIIYKNAVVDISYAQTSARTTENGLFDEVQSISVVNKSTIISTDIELYTIETTCITNPVKINTTLTIPVCKTCEYSISTLLGIQVMHGNANNAIVKFENAGVYILEISDANKKYVQKVIVQ